MLGIQDGKMRKDFMDTTPNAEGRSTMERRVNVDRDRELWANLSTRTQEITVVQLKTVSHMADNMNKANCEI